MTESPQDSAGTMRKRLAIIGAGSSGLISLKYALDWLPDWEVRCFEQSGEVTGVWGNPYPGFVSTSTKYTTQFACYGVYDASVQPDGGASRSEFFRDGEYGQYLERFAAHFDLRKHITLYCRVEQVRRDTVGGRWALTLNEQQAERNAVREERFDAVIICTGLAANAKDVDCRRRLLSLAELTDPAGLGHITGQRIVVIGGGESAVDYASRLARSELNNEVFLSLRSGIRVSPRYHPIRGVPSDFLRNRLMLSIHEDLRNWIGQRFVEARIRHRELFQRLFPVSASAQFAADEQLAAPESEAAAHRKEWDHKLTKAAKDHLFNVFHNKSDDFLDAVGQRRIRIVGPAIDGDFNRFREFDSPDEIEIDPDLVVPAIGYQADLEHLSAGELRLADFYLGCCHIEHDSLYLVGFARPIIGNIPTISEMQARFVCGLLAETYARPEQIEQRHQADLTARSARYPKLNLDAIFPVEMFPYCDRLARLMGVYPTRRAIGTLRNWWRTQLEPATTLHYQCEQSSGRGAGGAAPIYMPAILVLLLLAIKPVDWVYRILRRQ